jgi:hypothetical protein
MTNQASCVVTVDKKANKWHGLPSIITASGKKQLIITMLKQNFLGFYTDDFQYFTSCLSYNFSSTHTVLCAKDS